MVTAASEAMVAEEAEMITEARAERRMTDEEALIFDRLFESIFKTDEEALIFDRLFESSFKYEKMVSTWQPNRGRELPLERILYALAIELARIDRKEQFMVDMANMIMRRIDNLEG